MMHIENTNNKKNKSIMIVRIDNNSTANFAARRGVKKCRRICKALL